MPLYHKALCAEIYHRVTQKPHSGLKRALQDFSLETIFPGALSPLFFFSSTEIEKDAKCCTVSKRECAPITQKITLVLKQNGAGLWPVDYALSIRRALQCWRSQAARAAQPSLRGVQVPLGHVPFCSSPKSSFYLGKTPTGTHSQGYVRALGH